MKKKSKYNIAVIGARGAVGNEIREILEERKFPVGEIRFFGSARSKGKSVLFAGKEQNIRELSFVEDDFQGIDIVLSSPGASVSKKFVPQAVKAGAIVIDNTSAFRMDAQVPLVIPEINGDDLKNHRGIIANPNCSTMIMLMAVAPLHRKNPVKRVVCSTYQAASGAGQNAMKELESQSRAFLAGKAIEKKVFPHQIAFNLFSHNSEIAGDGYNEEERKVVQESKKILHDESLQIAMTCVRVPVFRAHSQSINLEFERDMTVSEAHHILKGAPGIHIVDDARQNHFPMPIEASGKDDVLVGRIRKDPSVKNGLALFVSGDQLRKGAALNAVQIAETLIQKGVKS
jgi:aspartate-semialdehyde dehydrogenase